MTTEKHILVRLFFNRSDSAHYIQIGEDSLFKIPKMVAARVQEKEGLQIVHALDLKDIQVKANEKK